MERLGTLGIVGVPHRKSSTSPKKPVGTKTFRKHYDELEAKRAELLGRLANLGGSGRKHSGYASAMQLLQTRFRRATLAQRAAVLQSAAWMIELLEHLTSVL